MVRIIQTQLTSGLGELLRRQPLKRSLRGHGHKYWELNGTVREVEGAGTGFCSLT